MIVHPAGEVVEQVEQRRLGPVDVLEAENQRPLCRQRLEVPADAPECLLGRGGLTRSRRSAAEHALGRELALICGGERLLDGPLAAGVADELGERPERDPSP